MIQQKAKLASATEAWTSWCWALQETGIKALENTITGHEIDFAEGLRHMGRMTSLALLGATENTDDRHPYLWATLGPHLKMGGDNPQGLYLSAPLNPYDTFVISGTRGSARWFSAILGRTPAARSAGEDPFGNALFVPDLRVGSDSRFEIIVSPAYHEGNWLQPDEWTASILIRQFFGRPDDVRPMELTIENSSRSSEPPVALSLESAVASLQQAASTFAGMVPYMQSELIAKGERKNTFATDEGDPTSRAGGVPGGNAVTGRWMLEPAQALLVRVVPPVPCAYWDAQVGNGWYESFDYRHYFSGLTCEQAYVDPDGVVTLVVCEQDPGTVNWLETARHKEGHIAIRWQLSDGNLPIPDCTVVDVETVSTRTGLPAVSPEEREAQREALCASFDARFGF